MSVTHDDIATALGRSSNFTTDEAMQWEMWIGDALLLIGARLDIEDLDEAKVDYVVREAVVAHVKHPDDATQVSVSVDDATTARTYKSGKGRVTIIDEWWEILSPTTAGKAFSLDTACAGTFHQPWCSLYFGADYCSCGADIAGFPIYENAEP